MEPVYDHWVWWSLNKLVIRNREKCDFLWTVASNVDLYAFGKTTPFSQTGSKAKRYDTCNFDDILNKRHPIVLPNGRTMRRLLRALRNTAREISRAHLTRLKLNTKCGRSPRYGRPSRFGYTGCWLPHRKWQSSLYNLLKKLCSRNVVRCFQQPWNFEHSLDIGNYVATR